MRRSWGAGPPNYALNISRLPASEGPLARVDDGVGDTAHKSEEGVAPPPKTHTHTHIPSHFGKSYGAGTAESTRIRAG